MFKFTSSREILIKPFIEYRIASDRWNSVDEKLMLYFDRHCSKCYPEGQGITQEMVDSWCAKRNTEISASCYGRTYIIAELVKFLINRGMTDIKVPLLVEPDRQRKYIPHAFTAEELNNFFMACDARVLKAKTRESTALALTASVYFRLIYSTGMRTVEARLLRVEKVDLTHGVIDIQYSKGRDQHYVVLHDTMLEVLQKYNKAVSSVYCNRVYFFPYTTEDPLYQEWSPLIFREIWDKVNSSPAVPYDLRHNYATHNINSWTDDGFGFTDKFIYLSKSMGHKRIESTRYYYSLVPALSQTIEEQTMKGFDEIIPEVNTDEATY